MVFWDQQGSGLTWWILVDTHRGKVKIYLTLPTHTLEYSVLESFSCNKEERFLKDAS